MVPHLIYWLFRSNANLLALSYVIGWDVVINPCIGWNNPHMYLLIFLIVFWLYETKTKVYKIIESIRVG